MLEVRPVNFRFDAGGVITGAIQADPTGIIEQITDIKHSQQTVDLRRAVGNQLIRNTDDPVKALKYAAFFNAGSIIEDAYLWSDITDIPLKRQTLILAGRICLPAGVLTSDRDESLGNLGLHCVDALLAHSETGSMIEAVHDYYESWNPGVGRMAVIGASLIIERFHHAYQIAREIPPVAMDAGPVTDTEISKFNAAIEAGIDWDELTRGN